MVKVKALKGTIVFGTNGPQAVMREPGDQPAIQSWPETALLLDFIRYDRGACALFINLLAFTVGALKKALRAVALYFLTSYSAQWILLAHLRTYEK